MHQFIGDIKDTDFAFLDKEESHHAIKVLRLQAGAEVIVTDGKGKWCEGTLTEAHSKGCVIKIAKTEIQPERKVRLHVAIAPTKNIDRLEWFLEKATECGIDEITPIFCTNSERTVIKPDRLQKVLVAAMKQSQRAHLPNLNPALAFGKFVENNFDGNKFVAHCHPGEKLPIKSALKQSQDTLILIGPEGDFTSEEVELAFSRGFEPVSLGNFRLRTETAAVVSCVCFNFANEMF
jgi:16S rRNA (uracil1498-N3)-methyltransferase